MESFGNERQVQQGEDWNLDIKVSASDREYIPFIVSSDLHNPFFVCTVASTKYEKNLRYVKSWWNSLKDLNIPTFYQTVPVSWGELKYKRDELGDIIEPEEYEDLPASITDDSKTERYLYQYTKEGDEIDTSIGHKPYYYFYFEYNDDGTVKERIDEYDCYIRFNFLSKDTADWSAQNYMYQITLVEGELMADRLNEIYDEYKPKDWPDTDEARYRYVKVQWPDELQPDIDVDSPLGYIETPIPILRPTKLEVFNNLRRLI